jgi:alkaline phosphatase D
MRDFKHSRRQFIQSGALIGGSLSGLAGILTARTAPAAITSESARPATAWGIQVGDVTDDRALVWCRTDRPAKMEVSVSRDERFRHARTAGTALVLANTDFVGRVDLEGLPPDAELFVRVQFRTLGHHGVTSAPLFGRFRTAPKRPKKVRFVWGGDTAGQGWGIDLGFGGMKCYEAMRRVEPHFFLHSGDTIYADGPMAPQVTDRDGNVIWTNAFLDVVPEKLKVAETLHEFRRNYLYNRYDAHVQAFSAEVPQIWQWDDHEIVNNWSPGKILDSRYTVVTDVKTLVQNATQAFREYAPIRFGRGDRAGRMYRHVPYGPDLDIFVIDMRSYRAANGCNTEPAPGPETAFLGAEQLAWLKHKLSTSRATWKVIAADMPIGLIVGDGTAPSGCPRFENSSNGNGPVLGREFEIAEILNFIQRKRVDGVVWLTADVHYAAAHYYDPSVAQYQDFDPFWEFVSGPLHAGSFGPNALDDTFGPTVIFEKAPPAGQVNLPPSAGLQFFGQVDIDPVDKKMVVAFKDLNGAEIFSQELVPGMRW